MANRSYLYALNGVPAPSVSADALEVTGISEFGYYVPLVYKLLVSSDARACQSLIWSGGEQTAIIGSYAGGVERLRAFLQRIEYPTAAPLVNAAFEFLALERNQRRYFLLEAAETFFMSDDPLELQNAELLNEIRQLEPTLEPLPILADAARPTSWFARLFPLSPKALEEPLLELGLGYWSDTLYFDPRQADSEDENP